LDFDILRFQYFSFQKCKFFDVNKVILGNKNIFFFFGKYTPQILIKDEYFSSLIQVNI